MNVRFVNDTARGRGYGILHLSDLDPMVVGEGRFSLCRAADMCYLTKNNWQNAEEFQVPQSCMVQNGEVLLYVGPDVVDQLQVNENYRLCLACPDGQSQRSVLAIDSIYYSLAGQKGNAQIYSETPPAATVPPLQDEPKEPTPEPMLLMQPPEPASQKRLWPLALGLCILALLGGVWWYVHPGAKVTEQTTADTAPKLEPNQPSAPAAPPKADTATPDPVPPVAEKPKSDPAAPPPSAREQVRTFFAGLPAAETALALAKQLPTDTAEDQDALYRLYYFASEGTTSARETLPFLAKAVDPTTPMWGSITKDAVEAWIYYQKMDTLSDATLTAQAKQQQDALKTWLTAESAKGNAKATHWLEQLTKIIP